MDNTISIFLSLVALRLPSCHNPGKTIVSTQVTDKRVEGQGGGCATVTSIPIRTNEILDDGFVTFEKFPTREVFANLGDGERDVAVTCKVINLFQSPKNGATWTGTIPLFDDLGLPKIGVSVGPMFLSKLSDEDKRMLIEGSADFLNSVEETINCFSHIQDCQSQFEPTEEVSKLPFLEDHIEGLEARLQATFSALDGLNIGIAILTTTVNGIYSGRSIEQHDQEKLKLDGEPIVLANLREQVLRLLSKVPKNKLHSPKLEGSSGKHDENGNLDKIRRQWPTFDWHRTPSLTDRLTWLPSNKGFVKCRRDDLLVRRALAVERNASNSFIRKPEKSNKCLPTESCRDDQNSNSLSVGCKVRKTLSTPSISFSSGVFPHRPRALSNKPRRLVEPKRINTHHSDDIASTLTPLSLHMTTESKPGALRTAAPQVRAKLSDKMVAFLAKHSPRKNAPDEQEEPASQEEKPEFRLQSRWARSMTFTRLQVSKSGPKVKYCLGDLENWQLHSDQNLKKTHELRSRRCTIVSEWWRLRALEISRLCSFCGREIFCDLDSSQVRVLQAKSTDDQYLETFLRGELKKTKKAVRSVMMNHLFHYLITTRKNVMPLVNVCAQLEDSAELALLDEIFEMCEHHKLFLKNSAVLELVSSPVVRLRASNKAQKLLATGLLNVLSSWRDRRELLFFLIQQVSRSLTVEESQKFDASDFISSDEEAPIDDQGIFLCDFFKRTLLEALRQIRTMTPGSEEWSHPLSYLIEMFWLLRVESIRVPPRDLHVAEEREWYQPTTATLLILRLIQEADSVEKDLPPSTWSFLKIFFCHLKFKETLTTLTTHLAANRLDTADRRTDKLRKYLSTLPSDISRSAEDRHPSPKVADFEVNGAEDNGGPDQQISNVGADSGITEQPTAPLDEVLAAKKGNVLSDYSNFKVMSLEWLRSQLAGEVIPNDLKSDSGRNAASNFLSAAVATLFNPGVLVDPRQKFITADELRLKQRLESTETLRRNDLLPKIDLTDWTSGSYFPLPTDPSVTFKGIDIHKSYVIKSSKYPLVLTCEVVDGRGKEGEEGGETGELGKTSRIQLMFKSDEDLRQDALITNFLRFFEDQIFSDLYGLPTHLYRYQVLPLSCREGLVEFVPGAISISKLRGANPDLSLRSIISKTGTTLDSSSANAEAEDNASQSSDKFDYFLASCASYSVMMYVLAVGDRHLDNLMIDNVGRFFHIDYGYILGNDPKPFATVPMKLTKEMVECLGGWTSNSYRTFCVKCAQIFYILRKHHRDILNLMACTFSSQIADVRRLRCQLRTTTVPAQPQGNVTSASLNPTSNLAVRGKGDFSRNRFDSNDEREFHLFCEKVTERLRLDLDDAESVNFLIKEVVDVSVRSMFPLFVDKLHEWALYWR